MLFYKNYGSATTRRMTVSRRRYVSVADSPQVEKYV